MFSFYQNSGNFLPELLGARRAYNATDITSIISIRAHDANPWVIERLESLANHYSPKPLILILDFGSAPDLSSRIKDVADSKGFSYLRANDQGVFSLSIARNMGAQAAKTDLLYFTDIDFFSEPEHFGRLADFANRYNLSVIRDLVLNIPAYHLRREHSEEFFQTDIKDRSRFLGELSAVCAEKPVGEACEFVAPYSNNFLCTKVFFEICGGYNTGFRGHGSEDFEMIIRFGLHKDSADLPRHIGKDIYSPARKGFFGPRSYLGFRRLAEVDSFRAETNGFKCFHLWHPTHENCEWRKNNDWNRSKLKEALSVFRKNRRALLTADYLERTKTALCVCKSPQHLGYFLPLRAIGYKIEMIQDESEIEQCKKKMEHGDYDAFFIFNSHERSHREFLELFEMAGRLCDDRVVVELGALPSSVHYANDVSDTDMEFSDFLSGEYHPRPEILAVAEKVIERIVAGDWGSESSDGYDTTMRKLKECSKNLGKTRILIPLQPLEDGGVAGCSSADHTYAEFESSIEKVASENPEFEIVVKPHHSSVSSFKSPAESISVCSREDNIHALIDYSDFVLTYNSEVGLLALIHGKPVFTVGKAICNPEVLCNSVGDMREALEAISNERFTGPNETLVKQFVGWLCDGKYSFFDAGDGTRDKRNRNSYGYEGIMITVFNWKGQHLILGRSRALSRLVSGSYIDGRLGMNIGRFLLKGIVDSFYAETRRFGLRVRQVLKKKIFNKTMEE